MSDLVTLCEFCHDQLHAEHRSRAAYVSLETFTARFLGERIRKRHGRLERPPGYRRYPVGGRTPLWDKLPKDQR
jgi:hypothetical protein